VRRRCGRFVKCFDYLLLCITPKQHGYWTNRRYANSRTGQLADAIGDCACLVCGRPFVKRFALCHRSVVCPVLSVCDVRTLWPNGWTDQGETWHAGRPRPWPHCVRWGPSSPSPKGTAPQFSAHICCGQMTAWIKMTLGMELGPGPGDFVLDGDPAAPPPKGGGAESPKFVLSLLVYSSSNSTAICILFLEKKA